MGASYVPEIFMPSEKRILSPLFHDSYFIPPLGLPPAVAPTRKRLCATCVMFLFGAEFGLCVFLCDVQAAFQCGETLPKAACTFEFVEFAFQTAFGWQVRIRAFGLRLNDDSLDSYLLRLPNHLFIRKNDHFPFRIVSFPAARETVMLENIQNIFPNLRHIIIGVTIQ